MERVFAMIEGIWREVSPDQLVAELRLGLPVTIKLLNDSLPKKESYY